MLTISANEMQHEIIPIQNHESAMYIFQMQSLGVGALRLSKNLFSKDI